MVVHYSIVTVLGLSIFEGIRFFPIHSIAVLPVPREIALGLMWVTGIPTAASVLNLALRGLGAPFAVALSQRLATDLMYRYTRNPMVLGTILFLFSTGLFFGSLSFLIWVGGGLAPVWIYFVKAYEERELELRFGDTYLAYRSRTPFLIPGIPRD